MSSIDGTITESQARALSRIEDKKLQVKVAKISEGKSFNETDKIVTLIKQSPKEVTKALLDDKINVEQAERISKLKTEPEREKAIKEHQQIKKVEKNIEENIDKEPTQIEKREQQKQLIQFNNWVLSLKNSITEERKCIEKVIKLMLVNVKMVSIADDTQKEKLKEQLERHSEILERGLQISEQIENKL
jgi:hypothetical protein